MKGKTMLKVSSILMLIGGILTAIMGVIALIGIAALVALVGEEVSAGLLYFSGALVIVSAIVEIIAAAKGLGACKNPQKAKGCMPWGIIIAVLCVVSEILNVVGGGDFSIINLITGLVLPVLYIIGANQMKAAQ